MYSSNVEVIILRSQFNRNKGQKKKKTATATDAFTDISYALTWQSTWHVTRHPLPLRQTALPLNNFTIFSAEKSISNSFRQQFLRSPIATGISVLRSPAILRSFFHRTVRSPQARSRLVSAFFSKAQDIRKRSFWLKSNQFT